MGVKYPVVKSTPLEEDMAKVKIDMTEGKILPLLTRFALPTMATSVINQLFNTADTIVVGRWGGATPEAREIALSAVSACGPLVSMIITFFVGLSVGFTSNMSQRNSIRYCGKEISLKGRQICVFCSSSTVY